jgi:hypothetical protein
MNNDRGSYNDSYDHQDRAAKKARKNVERKHKSRRRHDAKENLKRFVDDYNAGKRDFYDDDSE